MASVDSVADDLVVWAPFPQVSEDGLVTNGLLFRQPDLCVNCQLRRCAEEHNNHAILGTHFSVCYRGLGVATVPFPSRNVVFNGLYFPEVLRKLPRKEKKRLETLRVEHHEVEEWARKTSVAIDKLDGAIQARTADAAGMLHDVQTSVSMLLRSAEEYVQLQPGQSFDQKLEALPGPAVNVVKNAQLLQARLAMMPLLTNPASAKYGQKHASPVYRIVDRLVRAMRPLADKRGVQLRLIGTSFKQPLAYDSFETIPLVLIDNAIKYSHPNQKVEVEVSDEPRWVQIEVRSFSPRLSEDDRPHIFEKGFRSSVAQRVTSRGSGLGLYIAQLVADAHGVHILHSCDDANVVIDGVAYCNNTFSLHVPL